MNGWCANRIAEARLVAKAAVGLGIVTLAAALSVVRCKKLSVFVMRPMQQRQKDRMAEFLRKMREYPVSDGLWDDVSARVQDKTGEVQ